MQASMRCVFFELLKLLLAFVSGADFRATCLNAPENQARVFNVSTIVAAIEHAQVRFALDAIFLPLQYASTFGTGENDGEQCDAYFAHAMSGG